MAGCKYKSNQVKERVKQMKKLVLFAIVLLTFAQLCGTAFAGNGDKAEITFKYDRLSGHATNQFAIWVEDAEGKYVDTVYATRFTATGGWEKRPAALHRWVGHAEVAKMNKAEIDAITGATPKAGTLTYTWDLTDKNGKKLPDGPYMILLEATLRNENSVVYRALVEVGGDSVTLHPIPKYAGKDEADRKMISEVTVRYIDD